MFRFNSFGRAAQVRIGSKIHNKIREEEMEEGKDSRLATKFIFNVYICLPLSYTKGSAIKCIQLIIW
jgi:hypothetical protein